MASKNKGISGLSFANGNPFFNGRKRIYMFSASLDPEKEVPFKNSPFNCPHFLIKWV